MIRKTIKRLAVATISLSFLFSAGAFALGGQSEPVELLIDFKIEGQFTGMTDQGAPIYTINGPGFSPWYIFRSGEIIDKTLPWREVAQLSNAQITFNGMPTDPILNFTCLQGSCNLSIGGSTFQSDAGVPLAGRAANLWGPIVQSPDFDPVNGIAPIRILGCGGLTETSGQGKYAGMVGAICFNGALNFNQNDQSVLTGGSKCTITLHTPAFGPIPPEGPGAPPMAP